MKIRNVSKALSLASLLFSSVNGWADIIKTFTISDDDYIEQVVQLGDDSYTKIVLVGADEETAEGKFALPIYNLKFYIPFGEVATEVTCTYGDTEEKSLKNAIAQNGAKEPTAMITEEDSDEEDYYTPESGVIRDSSQMLSPAVPFESNDVNGIGTVDVKVSPIVINSPKSVTLFKSFTIRIRTKKAASTTLPTLSERDIHELVVYLKTSAANTEDIADDLEQHLKENIAQAQALRAGGRQWSVPFYEYVVITSKELVKSFEPLVTWKRRKGLHAGVVAIEDILADEMATEGDAISGLHDEAGILRSYIKASKDAGIGFYVLLGGNDKIIPVRYGTGSLNTHKYQEPDDMRIPSDIYYSNLNTNWNSDGDKFLGECSSWDEDRKNGEYDMSLYQLKTENAQIVYVGRLMCESSDDVATWTRKQLLYEQNPGHGDFSYLSRMLISRSDQIYINNNSKYSSDKYGNYYSLKRLEEEEVGNNVIPTFPKGVDVITEINKNYGIISNHNHGSPYSYQIATVNYNDWLEKTKRNVFSADFIDTKENYAWAAIEEPNNGFDNLTNFDYPSIFHSPSCENMPFDNYKNYRGKGLRTLGEAFTVVNKGGGIAYLGNTRYGWCSDSPLLMKKFFEIAELRHNLNEFVPLGIVEYISKCQQFDMMLIHSHNLAGCPETHLWMQTPEVFKGITHKKKGDAVEVTIPRGEYVPNTLVHVTSGKDGGISYCKTDSVQDNKLVLTFSDAPDDYVVVVTQPRHVPFISASMSEDCDNFIQNEVFTEDETRECTNITAGETVTISKQSGKVIVKEGAKLTIISSEKTDLMEGFVVEEGAALEVK